MQTPRQIRGACPLDCPDTCSWIVTVDNDRAITLAGDRHHPYTRGALCVKVNDYLSYTRSPHRLLYPLRRTGAKGEGKFTRISWEAALEEMARRWQDIIARDGSEAIWPYFGTGNMGMLQGLAGGGRRLWNVLGASQHQVTICTIAGGVGTGYTLGHNQVGMDPETLAHSRLILLWGANVVSTHHHLWRSITTARRQGAWVVSIDPVRTRTAALADQHLAPVPGTDAALALGLLHVVLMQGAEDREFIEAHTLGWEAFRQRILEYPPSRVARITGIDEAEIRALGHRLATSRPTGIRATMGMQRHAGGGMAIRTITCMPGVTGDWRYPGGGVCYDTRGFFPGNWQALWRDDLRPPDTRTLNMTRLGEGLLELNNPPVNALFVYGSNPVASVPHQNKIRQGLAREDLFTVVAEHFHTDTTAYADIVLPATMQVEQADLHHSYGHVYLNWNAPAVSPPGACLPTSEMCRRLARSLGLTEPCLYESDEDLARAVLDSDDLRRQGITIERLQETGWVRLDVPAAPFATGFPSPSGKLEFYCARMAEDGLDPLAGYTPPYEVTQRHTALARKYPLSLIAAAAHNFLNSTFANMAKPATRQGPLPIMVHPHDATARGLVSGQEARVFNDRGAFRAQVEVSDNVQPGVVASVKGYWPGRMAGSANVNATVHERDTDMGGGAVFHDNRVEVEATM